MNNTSTMPTSNYIPELYYRDIQLENAADIVRYSYIVQDSICYLDLELSKSCRFQDYSINSSTVGSSFRGVINTNEKCRKSLEKRRYLLYNLHLDVAKEREMNLKNSSLSDTAVTDSFSPFIAKIRIAEEFYDKVLYRFIKYACQYTDHKMRVLKWFLRHFETKTTFAVPAYIINYFVECMHPEFNDTEFVNECFGKLNFINWTLSYEKPEGVGNLLYQIHLLGRRPEHIGWSNYFMERCFIHRSLLYVGEILKFRDTFCFCWGIHNYLMHRVLRSLSSPSQEQFSKNLNEMEATSWKSRQRSTLLLQVFWLYLNLFDNNASEPEALRLVWNSVPDALFSSKEIYDILENVLSPTEIVKIYAFYSQAVCESHALVEPRSLTHYCRICIRKSLWRNKQWIPQGVQRVGLPTPLQDFISLEY